MNDKKNIRMCICCRQQKDKYSLVRICNINGEAYFDKNGKMGGRGTYVCCEECFLKASRTGRLSKALKCHIDIEKLGMLGSVFTNG